MVDQGAMDAPVSAEQAVKRGGVLVIHLIRTGFERGLDGLFDRGIGLAEGFMEARFGLLEIGRAHV